MENKPNLDLFNSREEFPELIDSSTGKCINLRTTQDISLVENILSQLRSKGGEYVIASWLSPPFGEIEGYGIYQIREARNLSQRSKEERWGYPRFGAIYDQDRLERRILRLTQNDTGKNLHLTYQL